MIIYNISVLMGENNTLHAPTIKCNDTGVRLRIFPVIRTPLSKYRDKLEAYTIPEGCTAVLKVAKPDGTYALSDGKIKNNSMCFKLPPQACTALGKAKAEASIYGPDGRRITTGTFVLEVEKEAVADHDPDSKWYVDILSEYIKAVTDAKDDAEAAAERAEEAAKNAGGTGTGAVTVEVHSPIIGEDGAWWLWDDKEKQYVNSGVNAYGEQGPKGDTGADGKPFTYDDMTEEQKADLLKDAATKEVLERLNYYGDKDIVPSSEGLFEFVLNEDGKGYSVSANWDVTNVGITDIVIPYEFDGLPVTAIGNAAFIVCTSLTSVNIPNTVTSIGSSAFKSCTGLTSVNIPDSVTTIGETAFCDCTGLTSVNIPDSVTTIGETAFLRAKHIVITCSQGSCAEQHAKNYGMNRRYTKVSKPDTTPTENSDSLITSGGVYAAIGDVETALENIIAKYGLGGETQ